MLIILCLEPLQIKNTWGRFLKEGINYTMYNSYFRDKSAILGITIPVIKWVPGNTIYPLNSYSRDTFATLRINLPKKGDSQLTNRFAGKLSAMRASCLGLKHCEGSEARTKFFCICVNMYSEDHTGNSAV